jgi:hypothetical protein
MVATDGITIEMARFSGHGQAWVRVREEEEDAEVEAGVSGGVAV